MNFSLNEMEAIAKRAARGAGYPWGLAEEASKATPLAMFTGFGRCRDSSTAIGTWVGRSPCNP